MVNIIPQILIVMNLLLFFHKIGCLKVYKE